MTYLVLNKNNNRLNVYIKEKWVIRALIALFFSKMVMINFLRQKTDVNKTELETSIDTGVRIEKKCDTNNLI